MTAMSFSSVRDDLVRKVTTYGNAFEKKSPVKKFSGTWSGTMHFINSSYRNEIVLTILSKCEPGRICGHLHNRTIGSVWELTLDEVKGDVLSYSFSKTLQGEFPSDSTGKLILRSDGTLYRVHQTPDGIVSGALNRIPPPGRRKKI
jgi:hypothetical protein